MERLSSATLMYIPSKMTVSATVALQRRARRESCQRAAYRLRAPTSALPLEAVVDPRSHGRRNATREETQTRGKPTARRPRSAARNRREARSRTRCASRRGAHSTPQKPCRINNSAHKRSSFAPTPRAARPRTAKPRSRSGAGRETEASPVFYAPVRATRGTGCSPLALEVHRGFEACGRRPQRLRTP